MVPTLVENSKFFMYLSLSYHKSNNYYVTRYISNALPPALPIATTIINFSYACLNATAHRNICQVSIETNRKQLLKACLSSIQDAVEVSL